MTQAQLISAESKRYRFNWGYHDGAQDRLQNRVRRWPTNRPEFAIYDAAYKLGWEAAKEGAYTGDSEPAWRAYRGKAAA